MIHAIDLSRLRNAEYLQFMKNFASLVDANDPTALSVLIQYTLLLTKNTELEDLFKKSQASEITQEILDIDLRRDRAYNGIIAVVEGFTYHYEADKVLAAN